MIDRSSYRLLKKLYREKEMVAEDAWSFVGHKDGLARQCPQISALLSAKFIQGVDRVVNADLMKASRYFSITIAGMAFVEQRRRDGRNFWVPYVITTILAIASLVVALYTAFQSAQ